MSDPIALWLKQRYALIRIFLLALISMPAIYLFIGFQYQSLGVNPLQTLQQLSGLWAMIFFCITLAITPLRRFSTYLSQLIHSRYGKRLSDWNWIIRTRRMFGLASFFYAAIHLFIFIHFDLDYDWQWALEDFQQKYYLSVGLLTFLLLVPLAVTSPQLMMKKMGKNWRRLHRLMYPISLLALLHVWLAVKSGFFSPWYFTAIVIPLLAYRGLSAWGVLVPKARDNGMEVKSRDSQSRIGA